MKTKNLDLICLSHLRWNFVFQRPQHLMSRFARTRRVFYFEEPVFEDTRAHLRTAACRASGVQILTPVLPNGLTHEESVCAQRDLLRSSMSENKITDYLSWYYTPMATEFSSDLRPQAVVYDCMDELSAFANAPVAMRDNEQALFRSADLVFTGGASLFESKRKQHCSVHLFPSSIDAAHFARARDIEEEPEDQALVPRPRLGYAGVIDERMDLQLLREVAAARPRWQFVLVGPVVKIDPASLPQARNIHYLGLKAYDDLPGYFSGWQIGLLPFALNQSTRFISPTKTPEYLAAGLPVISTPIHDVIHPYRDLGLVEIVAGTGEFLRVADSLLASLPSSEFLRNADKFVSKSSWDKTWSRMDTLIDNTILVKRRTVKDRASSQPLTTPGVPGVVHV